MFVDRLKALVSSPLEAARRAPIEVVLLSATFLGYLYADSPSSFAWSDWHRLLAVTGIAFPLLFSLSYLVMAGRVSASWRWIGQVIVLIFGVWIGWNTDFSEPRWAFAYGGLALAAWVFMSVAPGLRGAEPLQAAAYFSRVVIRLSLSMLYGLLLFAGLALALFAIDMLFDVDTDFLVRHAGSAVGVLVAPCMFLACMEDILQAENEAFEHESRLVRTAARILFAPLFLLYLLILYVYILRIVFTATWPEGGVTALVLGAAAMGFAGQLALVSLWLRPERQGEVGILFRSVPYALMLPLIMGFISMGLRIQQYGYTMPRYAALSLLVLATTLAMLDAIRRLRGKAPSVAAMGVAVIVHLIVGAVGPLSAVNVSVRSQTHEALTVAADAGLYADGVWVSEEALDALLKSDDNMWGATTETAAKLRRMSSVLGRLLLWVGAEEAGERLGLSPQYVRELSGYSLYRDRHLEEEDPALYGGWDRAQNRGEWIPSPGWVFHVTDVRHNYRQPLFARGCEIGSVRLTGVESTLIVDIGDQRVLEVSSDELVPPALREDWFRRTLESDRGHLNVEIPFVLQGGEGRLILVSVGGRMSEKSREIRGLDYLVLQLLLPESAVPTCPSEEAVQPVDAAPDTAEDAAGDPAGDDTTLDTDPADERREAEHKPINGEADVVDDE